MKNLRNFALFILAAAVLSSCGGLNKMVKDADQVSYKVTPEVLEMHGGQVAVTVDVNYPVKYFNKKAVLTLTPVVKYEGGQTELKPIVVQGEDVTENNKVILYATGGKAAVSDKFEYQDQMMKSELYVQIAADMKGKTATFPDVKLADGIIATANLVEINPKTLTFADKFQRIIPDSYEADIKYIINKYDIRTSETKKDEIAALKEYIKNADADERIELKGIAISSYASPDGEYDLNDKLANNREKSAKTYINKELKKDKVTASDELFSMLVTAEDWDGFKKLLEESTIQDKDMILRVLSMYSDPAVREREIKNISAAFEVIAEEILPQLRRSKFTVNIDKIGYSDEELVSIWNSDPSVLGLEELLYTATLFEDLETKAAVYKKTTEAFPKCVRAFNNLGWALFNLGQLDDAEAALNSAKELKDNDITNNNLGAVALKKGELDKAKELFTASLGAGPDVNYNLGIVNLIQGEYDAAINYFGSEPSFNSSLAKYLKKDTEGAWRMIVNMPDESAKRYYLIAVITAKQDKPEVVYDNLRTAVAKDASLKERAVKDLEFAKLFNEAAFKAIVE